MKNFNLKNSTKLFSFQKDSTNAFYKSLMTKSKFSTTNKEINIKSSELNYHYPIRGFPKFENGIYTVFNYDPEVKRLPLVPYEIKECALKGWLYTFFLTWGGRLLSSALPSTLTMGNLLPYYAASVFLYQYGKAMHYMANAVTSIKLKENGTHVVFEFKNLRKPIEIEISRISKVTDCEKVIQESYAEPYLLPIVVNYEDIYGPSSLRSKKQYFIYGDSHSSIKDGEILRAIMNSQPIKLN
jgi:hypothetical protein